MSESKDKGLIGNLAISAAVGGIAAVITYFIIEHQNKGKSKTEQTDAWTMAMGVGLALFFFTLAAKYLFDRSREAGKQVYGKVKKWRTPKGDMTAAKISAK